MFRPHALRARTIPRGVRAATYRNLHKIRNTIISRFKHLFAGNSPYIESKSKKKPVYLLEKVLRLRFLQHESFLSLLQKYWDIGMKV